MVSLEIMEFIMSQPWLHDREEEQVQSFHSGNEIHYYAHRSLPTANAKPYVVPDSQQTQIHYQFRACFTAKAWNKNQKYNQTLIWFIVTSELFQSTNQIC